jgi:uncharacterized protein (TIGR02118 family)
MAAYRGHRGPRPDPEDDVAYQLTVLYHHPDDVAGFDRHYDGTHVPLAAKMPGLRSYTVSRPGPGPDGNKPSYHLVAALTWDSAEELQAGMSSPEGQAAVADLANFAGAGVDILTGPSEAVV